MSARRIPSWALVAVPIVIALVVAVSMAGRRSPAPSSPPAQPTGGQAASTAGGTLAAPAAGGSGASPVAGGSDRQGAAGAALDYLATLSSLVGADPAGREATLRSLAAPGAPAVVTRTLEGMAVLDRAVAAARAALPSARVLVKEVPVSYTVAAHDGARARVEVWSVGVVLIEGRTDATEVWSTNTVELSWAGDRWRVWDWSRTSGPVPAPTTDSPTAPADVLAGVGTWDEVAYAPGR